MKLTVESLEAVEQAAMEDIKGDLKNAEHNRLMALLRAIAGVKADLVRSESAAKLANLKK
jgi:hypothetical protein